MRLAAAAPAGGAAAARIVAPAPPAAHGRSAEAADAVRAALPREVRRIGVFRALVLGDWLCAVPALRALAGGWPEAEITLIGLPWTRELAARLSMVRGFAAFPGFPGLPEIAPDRPAFRHFLREQRARPFDLLLQLHGSGSTVNALVAACRPHRSAGFVETALAAPAGRPGTPATGRVPHGLGRDDTAGPSAPLYTPWPRQGHEIERLLRLTDHLGLPRRGTQLEFPLGEADRLDLLRIWPGAGSGAPYACIHPGSQLPSRRWPAERFAAVADRLAAQGCTVVLTGSAAEKPLVAEVRRHMRAPVIDLSGATSLWTLGALVEGARLVVANDTGISHIAAALGTPSVIVSSGGDAPRWAPLDTARHVVLAADVPCRPCAHPVCPTAHECAAAVQAGEVAAMAERLLDGARTPASSAPTTTTASVPAGDTPHATAPTVFS